MLNRALVSSELNLKMWLLLLVAVVGANPQYTKTVHSGVKGGYSTYENQYNSGANQIRYTANGTQQGQQHYGGTNYPGYEEAGVGVCFIEVPTASLVRDPLHVPAGNGSRPDLSRIRSCCKGYIRNIYNYRLCEPVCAEECINALCSAPDTCTCFPDHVKNAAGFCIPTCPIGCQNGRCAGGECICKDGFKLDRDSKYCLPSCQENCGGVGVGNCTSPNTCTCKPGYESTPTGSCRPTCTGGCRNGDCVALNDCRCRHGYSKEKTGVCEPFCTQNCGPNGHCIAPNTCSNPTTTTPSNHNYQPYYANSQNNYPYYSPGNHSATYNLTASSQVKPYQPDPHQPYQPDPHQPYNPINYTLHGPNGPLNQTNPYGYQPYNPSNPNQPTNYPYNPNSQPGQYPYNPSGQPGHYPFENQSGQPGPYHNIPTAQPGQYPYPTGQPGQYTTNPSGQPGQYPNNNPTFHPGQSPYNPSGQPGQYPNQGYPVDSNYTNLYQPYNPMNQNPYDQHGNEDLVPRCSQPCINGYCIEGNRCSCNSGYELDGTDPSGTRCRPHCAGGCENGVCSSPNFCICNMGYRKEHGVKGGSSRCVRRMKRSIN